MGLPGARDARGSGGDARSVGSRSGVTRANHQSVAADHLPPYVAAEMATAWLERRSGLKWSLVRLLESLPKPWVWLDCSLDTIPRRTFSLLFRDRTEGFIAPIGIGQAFDGDAPTVAVLALHFDRSLRPTGRPSRLSRRAWYSMAACLGWVSVPMAP